MNTRIWQSEEVQDCTENLTLMNAVKCSNLNNLKWLKQVIGDDKFRIEGRELIHCMSQAAHQGDLEIIKWLYANGAPLHVLIFRSAARNGKLEVMKWLKENQCEWDEEVFRAAAKHGNLENMKWLKKQQCPWYGNTFSAAAKRGDLETMKWLRKINAHGMGIPFVLQLSLLVLIT